MTTQAPEPGVAHVSGRPLEGEAAPYYSTYMDRIQDDDILGVLETQLAEVGTLLAGISEERSLFRYAEGKWSIREVLSHLNDGERLFAFRAFWFARSHDTPLPSFDEKQAAVAAEADRLSWADHVEEFRRLRLGTLSLFRGLPTEAWSRRGIASGNPFTVRALAYIVAGHVSHHAAVLEERYL